MSDIELLKAAFPWAGLVKPGLVKAGLVKDDANTACCVNPGCGTVFDPVREGFNGECDYCAALAADHFSGGHRGLELDCVYCWAEPAEFERSATVAA
ncbi:MAG: hypothetical protein QOE23_2538 [Pseudonocardiales bacterium]|jgi:hypothetical protein|nr:hypothetical protein [Pseudonocardiales bacterium]